MELRQIKNSEFKAWFLNIDWETLLRQLGVSGKPELKTVKCPVCKKNTRNIVLRSKMVVLYLCKKCENLSTRRKGA